jgi:hypothetical protein
MGQAQLAPIVGVPQIAPQGAVDRVQRLQQERSSAPPEAEDASSVSNGPNKRYFFFYVSFDLNFKNNINLKNVQNKIFKFEKVQT